MRRVMAFIYEDGLGEVMRWRVGGKEAYKPII